MVLPTGFEPVTDQRHTAVLPLNYRSIKNIPQYVVYTLYIQRIMCVWGILSVSIYAWYKLLASNKLKTFIQDFILNY